MPPLRCHPLRAPHQASRGVPSATELANAAIAAAATIAAVTSSTMRAESAPMSDSPPIVPPAKKASKTDYLPGPLPVPPDHVSPYSLFRAFAPRLALFAHDAYAPRRSC